MITAFIRTVILYFLIMIGMRLMGKRQIGELEPGELVLTMMISDLASVPMQDFGIPLLSGIISILTLLSLSLMLSQFSLRNLHFRELLCGTPCLLVRDGVLLQQTMRENRYTLDELLEELRGQGFSSLEDIQYAVLENSGHLSVFPWVVKPDTQSGTTTTPQSQIEDKNQEKNENTTLPYVLINDGRIVRRNLTACQKNVTWLYEVLRERDIDSPSDVFLLTLDKTGKIFCIQKDEERRDAV